MARMHALSGSLISTTLNDSPLMPYSSLSLSLSASNEQIIEQSTSRP